MAGGEARFTCLVQLYRESSVPTYFSQVGYHLQICKFVVHDDGSTPEDEEARLQEKSFLPEIAFGRVQHRNHVAHLLRGAGWPQRNLELILDVAFSRAMSILEKVKITPGSSIIPIINFCLIKFVRCEDELQESMALQLSMQEAPKPVPATKESIQALKKVKLEGDITEECMICMDQLSSETNVTRMPCSHLFHGDCIEKWLNTSHKCPLCRFPMPIDG